MVLFICGYNVSLWVRNTIAQVGSPDWPLGRVNVSYSLYRKSTVLPMSSMFTWGMWVYATEIAQFQKLCSEVPEMVEPFYM